jgi:prolipoprotein diacylglyceryltransferase
MGFIGIALMALGIIDDFLSWFDIVFIESNWVSVPMILVGLSLTAAATVSAEEEIHEEVLRERRKSRNR